MLECLSEDQCFHVLRATPVHGLAEFPQSYKLLALMAHYSTVKSTKSLEVQLSDPKTTLQVSSCLASLTMLTALSFKPWLDDHATREVFQAIQTLPRLLSLDVGGMYLSAAACAALGDSLQVCCTCSYLRLCFYVSLLPYHAPSPSSGCFVCCTLC